MSATPILYIIDNLTIGGAQHHLWDVVTSLDREAFSPLVCSLAERSPLAEKMSQGGFEVRSLGLRNIYGRKALGAMVPLARWIRRHRVRLVHTYLPSASLYGTVAARLAGVSRIITSRRDMGFSRSWKMGLVEQLVVNPQVRRVVTVCDAVGRQAEREWFLGPGKVRTIPNGVDLTRPVGSDRPREVVRESIGAGKDQVVFAIVARLKPIKAHEVFLDAAGLVLARHPEALFVLVGDGPRREAFERQVAELDIGDHVRFRGNRSRTETADIIRASDVGVLCSDTEGMSNAILEYMTLAKPVVATAVGGNEELVTEGESGFLVPVRDPAALAQAMIELIADPCRAEAFGLAGRRRVETLFTRERMVHALERVYQEVLDETRRWPMRSRARRGRG